jgi:upstream activation factor subunit UAF30
MVVPKPSNDELTAKIKELVWTVDLETVSLKAFIKLLSSNLDDVDLKPRKAFIKEALTKALQEGKQEEEVDNDASSSSEVEDDDEEEDADMKATSPKKGGGGGLKAVKKLSAKLSAFIGKGQSMARTEVVKSIWDYIKEHELQNPQNKREIFLDQALQDVFGCETFTMFTMNKYLSAHIEPFKPVDLTTNSTGSSTPTSKKRKAAVSSSTNKKTKKTGSQPPYRLSKELAAVVGTDVLPRPQVVKQLWVYIKKHDLQDAADKRRIVCDDLLLQVFKKPKISMFAMNAELSRHLYERVDRSEYRPDDNDNAASDDDGADQEAVSDHDDE